jgi:hypothetical protein
MALTQIKSSNITDGTIVNADVNASAAIASTKLSGVESGLTSVQVFTSSGTWTRPTGITKVVVEVVGGGGSSGSGDVDWSYGGSGGSGGYARKFLDVSSISTSTITVGAGGVKNAGTAAGASSWADGTNTITGGAGGNGTNGVHPSPEHGTGGLGGTASGGDLNMPGSSGCIGQTANRGMTQGSYLSTGGHGDVIQRTQSDYGAATVGKSYGGGAGAGGGNNATVDGADGGVGVVYVSEYK